MTLDVLERRIQGLSNVFQYPLTAIVSGTGKPTDFKIIWPYIHRVHPNKSPLKILEKRERGTAQSF